MSNSLSWRKRDEVLRYSLARVSQATVRRHYRKWRAERGIPPRCDNPECRFHREPLVWNGKPLPLILDHKDGNRLDNRPKMLRYLCPNCDSLLDTRGGANQGRVEGVAEDRFTIVANDGHRKHELFLDERMQAADTVDASVTTAGSSSCGSIPEYLECNGVSRGTEGKNS